MKSSVVQCSPDVDDNNSNKEVIQITNTVVCKFKQKKTNRCCSLYFKVQRVELPRHFFAEANYEKS